MLPRREIRRPLTAPLTRAITEAGVGSLRSAVLGLFPGASGGAVWDTTVRSSLWQDLAGTVPVTTPGDLVRRIDDLSGNGRHLTQITDASRGVYQVDAFGNGYIDLDGSNDYYEVTGSTGMFNFLHDGTGCCAMIAVALDTPLTAAKLYPLFATSAASVGSRGAAIFTTEAAASNITSQQQFSFISNGVAAVINGTSGGQGSVRGDGNGQVLGYTYATQSGSDFFAYCDGDNFNLGRAESNAPSASNSALSLRIGNIHGASYLPGKFYGAVLLGKNVTTDQRRTVINYLKSLYSDNSFILGVGDSQTYNTAYSLYMRGYYPALIESELRADGQRAPALNYGISGNTTTQILARMTSVLEQGTPSLAIVYAGQNDVAVDTEANLETIVTQIRAAGCSRVLVVGTHYMNWTSGGDTTSVQDATFAALRVKQAAAAAGVSAPFVDLYAYMRALIVAGTYVQGDFAWHVADANTHLNAIGQQIIADAMMEVIEAQGWA